MGDYGPTTHESLLGGPWVLHVADCGGNFLCTFGGVKMNVLMHGSCEDVRIQADCIFMDPPDNIGVKYDGYDDNRYDYIGGWQRLSVEPLLWHRLFGYRTMQCGTCLSKHGSTSHGP